MPEATSPIHRVACTGRDANCANTLHGRTKGDLRQDPACGPRRDGRGPRDLGRSGLVAGHPRLRATIAGSVRTAAVLRRGPGMTPRLNAEKRKERPHEIFLGNSEKAIDSLRRL